MELGEGDLTIRIYLEVWGIGFAEVRCKKEVENKLVGEQVSQNGAGGCRGHGNGGLRIRGEFGTQ